MKITCTKENLSKALSLVIGVTGKSTNLPILANVLIKADEQKVEVIATNLELAIVANLRAKVEETGSFTVPARTLNDFINLLSDDKIDLEQKDSELLVKCGKSSTKIKGAPADEFPVVPTNEEGTGFSVSAEALKEGLTQVMPATAKSDIRPELSGMFFGFNFNAFSGLTLAATDSYRLAEKKIKLAQGQGEFKVIVPSHTAQEIIHVLSLTKDNEGETNVRLLLSENQIVMHYDNVRLVSRLVDGQYPDYVQIIPKDFKTMAEFRTAQLVKEIKAASLFTTAGVNAVSFDFKVNEETVKISSLSTQTGEHSSELKVEVKGENNSILLNHRYLLDGLSNISSEMTVFKMINSDSPCLFLPAGDDSFLYIVMPIRQ